MSERRRVRDAALAAVGAEIALRRAELAVLERAHDTIARGDVHCDGDDGRRCSALVHTAFCRVCGVVVRRCKAHGGQHAARAHLERHERSHGVGWSASAETDDSGGVLRGGAPLSVGGLSAPLAPDHSERRAVALEPADSVEASEPRTACHGGRSGALDR